MSRGLADLHSYLHIPVFALCVKCHLMLSWTRWFCCAVIKRNAPGLKTIHDALYAAPSLLIPSIVGSSTVRSFPGTEESRILVVNNGPTIISAHNISKYLASESWGERPDR